MFCPSLSECWPVIYSVGSAPCAKFKGKKMHVVPSLLSEGTSHRIQEGKKTCSKNSPKLPGSAGVSGQVGPARGKGVGNIHGELARVLMDG